MDFEEPINPMRAMNNEWEEQAEGSRALRLIGYTWDALLMILFARGAYTVLTDGSGLGLVAGLEGLLFTLGGLAVWALLIWLFLRPVGRAGMLKVVAVIRFIRKMTLYFFGGRAAPKG